MSFHRLANLLVAEGRLHERENCMAEAALIYVEVIRLGNELSRGELRLLGVACEAIGYDCLARVVPKLNGEEARAVLVALERMSDSRPTREDLEPTQRRFGLPQFA